MFKGGTKWQPIFRSPTIPAPLLLGNAQACRRIVQASKRGLGALASGLAVRWPRKNTRRLRSPPLPTRKQQQGQTAAAARLWGCPTPDYGRLRPYPRRRRKRGSGGYRRGVLQHAASKPVYGVWHGAAPSAGGSGRGLSRASCGRGLGSPEVDWYRTERVAAAARADGIVREMRDIMVSTVSPKKKQVVKDKLRCPLSFFLCVKVPYSDMFTDGRPSACQRYKASGGRHW